jgi:Secretion system C-terminal sorting domain
MRKVRLLFFSVSIFFSLGSFAQSISPAILNTTGGNYIFSYYVVEWSFGESMAINTMTDANSNVFVTNGILQPNTHNPATVNNTGVWGKDEIRILPNPTQNVIEIDFFSKQKGKVIMNLFDESGRYVGTRQFDYFGNGSIQKWDLSQFASGMYLLNIQLQPTGTSVAKKGSFKVIKIK